MISYFDSTLTQLAIHKVGNKFLEESLTLSGEKTAINDDVLDGLLKQYFVSPFEKTDEIYRLFHATGDINLNAVFHIATQVFDDPETFHESSRQIAKHLFDIADHPKIKSGELYCAYFKQLQVEGSIFDAIGIFKSESKEPYLTVRQDAKEFDIRYEEQAINIKKLDKGCLIFNTEKEEGYKVAIVDQTNRSEALYWMDTFLKLKLRNDNYTQTQNTLSIYKDFVTKEMDTEFDISKADKIDLLNRSIRYFKEKDHFDIEEFTTEVIGNEQGAQLFKQYKSNYEQEFDTSIEDRFAISNNAVKKQARVFRNVLKLDKNFHIYIHGDRELIEKGFDEQMNMNYYKVYFMEEK